MWQYFSHNNTQIFFPLQELLGQSPELAVVTLKNMKFCDVQSIIEVISLILPIIHQFIFNPIYSHFQYIYQGEVSLSRDQLGSFLATATSLKIKGYIFILFLYYFL